MKTFVLMVSEFYRFLPEITVGATFSSCYCLGAFTALVDKNTVISLFQREKSRTFAENSMTQTWFYLQNGTNRNSCN